MRALQQQQWLMCPSPCFCTSSVPHMCAGHPVALLLLLLCLASFLSYILARQTAQNENWNQKQMLTDRSSNKPATAQHTHSHNTLTQAGHSHAVRPLSRSRTAQRTHTELALERVSDARSPTRSHSLDIFTWRGERKSSQLTKTERTRRCVCWQRQRRRWRRRQRKQRGNAASALRFIWNFRLQFLWLRLTYERVSLPLSSSLFAWHLTFFHATGSDFYRFVCLLVLAHGSFALRVSLRSSLTQPPPPSHSSMSADKGALVCVCVCV